MVLRKHVAKPLGPDYRHQNKENKFERIYAPDSFSILRRSVCFVKIEIFN